MVPYFGLSRQMDAPDPRQPPGAKQILMVLHASNQTCDAVVSFELIGKNKGWDYYVARCSDGGRFVYMQSAAEGKVAAHSCAYEATMGYQCPE